MSLKLECEHVTDDALIVGVIKPNDQTVMFKVWSDGRPHPVYLSKDKCRQLVEYLSQ